MIQVAAPFDVVHILTETAALSVAFLVKGLWDNRRGRRVGKERDAALSHQLHGLREDIRNDMSTLSGEIAQLRAHVIGPDGRNGLRAEVNDLREQFAQFIERERRSLEEQAHRYDRRRTARH